MGRFLFAEINAFMHILHTIAVGYKVLHECAYFGETCTATTSGMNRYECVHPDLWLEKEMLSIVYASQKKINLINNKFTIETDSMKLTRIVG